NPRPFATHKQMQAGLIKAPKTAVYLPSYIAGAAGEWRCIAIRKSSSSRFPLAHLIAGQSPEAPLRIASQSIHNTLGQPVLGRIRDELPMMIPRDDTHFGSRPKIAVRILIKTGEAIAAEAGRIAFIEDGEAHAIKARQPIQCGDPEIAFRRLVNCGDDVLRQPGFRRPMIEAVLRPRG